jgi:shikimate dehydrogenase
MAAPDRYAVIGHPISHSKSPIIHSLFAEQTGENMRYEALDIAPNDLEEKLHACLADGFRGMNVTVPHKETVVPLMDCLTKRAELAGAVNTITRQDDGTLEGDNTDGLGLIADLRDNLHVELIDASILVLGAGGATRGIVPALMEQQPAELMIANRTVAKAEELAATFAELGNLTGRGFDQLEDRNFHVIINATSAGLNGEMPPFPASLISPDTVCYDLSYSMHDTPFIAWAKENGCQQTYQGWGMLIEQAAESFNIWRQIRPDTEYARNRLPG